MKILFYHNPPQGQTISYDVHITEVFNHLTAMGHTIIYINGKRHKRLELLKKPPSSPVRQSKSIWARVSEYIMNTPIRGEALVSFNLLKEIRLFLLGLKTMLREKPDLIYRRRGFLSIFGSEYILSNIFKIPTIEEVNGLAFDEAKIANIWDSLSIRIINSIEKHNLPRADKYITVTSKLKATLTNDYEVSKDKIVVIENGANTELFKPVDTSGVKNQLSLDERFSYICFVGVFTRWQGIEFIIKALPQVLEKFPNTRALLVGDGEVKNEAVELTGQLGIREQVIFSGRVPYEQVPLYINASEICLAPLIEEHNQRIGASSLKLYEYLACGKPVVASRISGFEVLEEYNAGILVTPEEPEELAHAIIKLLQDSILKHQMGENGRRYVLENRSWAGVAKNVERVCLRTIEENNQRRKQKKR